MDRTPVQMTAAVPELETVEMPVPAPSPAPLRPQLVTEAPPRRAPQNAQPVYQASLFGPMEAQRPQLQQMPPAPKKPVSRVRRDQSRQQMLDLQESRTLKTAIEASVYCGAPIAIAAHRVMAACVDFALAVAAVGVFVGRFYTAGADIVLTKDTLPFYTAAALFILLFYRVLFCIANRDTPGTRWTGLRVLDFDGRLPTRRQRWLRLLGGFVGAIAAGIGLIWAIFDEEKLTWHDHMSKTFPTPRFQ